MHGSHAMRTAAVFRRGNFVYGSCKVHSHQMHVCIMAGRFSMTTACEFRLLCTFNCQKPPVKKTHRCKG